MLQGLERGALMGERAEETTAPQDPGLHPNFCILELVVVGHETESQVAFGAQLFIYLVRFSLFIFVV